MRGLAAPRPEHQSLVPPLGLCSQPRLCGVRAGLQRCRDAFVGWEGAFTEHPASSSPLQELPPLVSSLKSGTSVFSCFFPCFSAQVNLQFADFRAVPSPALLTGHDAARPSLAKASLCPDPCSSNPLRTSTLPFSSLKVIKYHEKCSSNSKLPPLLHFINYLYLYSYEPCP